MSASENVDAATIDISEGKTKKKWKKKTRSRKNRMRRDTRPLEKRPTYYTKGADDYVGDSWSDRKFLTGSDSKDGEANLLSDRKDSDVDAQPIKPEDIDTGSSTATKKEGSSTCGRPSDGTKKASTKVAGLKSSTKRKKHAEVGAVSPMDDSCKGAHAKKKKKRRKKKKKRGSNDQIKRPGDWCCIGCNAHNFARRLKCINCQVKKTPEQTPQQLSLKSTAL